MFPWVRFWIKRDNYVKKKTIGWQHIPNWVFIFTVTLIWCRCQRCSPLPSPTSFFYFHPPLCADTSTQAGRVIPRYRTWALLFFALWVSSFFNGKPVLCRRKETFPDVLPEKLSILRKGYYFSFLFPWPDIYWCYFTSLLPRHLQYQHE